MNSFRRAAIIIPVVASLWVTTLAPQAVSAADNQDDKDWGVDTSVGFYSEYMFRGKNVYDGISINPSATAYYDFDEFGNISANVWVQAPAETNEPPEKFTEVDTTLAYGIEFGVVGIEVGHIFYSFPGGGEARIEDTAEFFGTISGDFTLHPSFTVYHDYDEGEYEYYTFRISEPFAAPLTDDEVTLEPYAMFGFASNANDDKVFYFENGLEHVDVGVTMELTAGRFYVSPNFNFTFEVDDAVQNEFWMGVDIGLSF